MKATEALDIAESLVDKDKFEIAEVLLEVFSKGQLDGTTKAFEAAREVIRS